jgi:CheY-like chemotaxis protein
MILVMDDEKVVRDVLKEMLLNLGFVVKTVNDGQQAIEELASKKNQYRAAILDLTVPGNMGGKEACEILRDSGITIPIFAASGYSSDPVIMDPESFGFDNSLAKPFSISELSEVLKITNLNFAN